MSRKTSQIRTTFHLHPFLLVVATRSSRNTIPAVVSCWQPTRIPYWQHMPSAEKVIDGYEKHCKASGCQLTGVGGLPDPSVHHRHSDAPRLTRALARVTTSPPTTGYSSG